MNIDPKSHPQEWLAKATCNELLEQAAANRESGFEAVEDFYLKLAWKRLMIETDLKKLKRK